MAINKKLIHFKKKETFLSDQGVNGKPLEPTEGTESGGDALYGQIYGTSIVFIKDTKEIWTHGQLYSCEDYGDEEVQALLDANVATTDEIDKTLFPKAYYVTSDADQTLMLELAYRIYDYSKTVDSKTFEVIDILGVESISYYDPVSNATYEVTNVNCIDFSTHATIRFMGSSFIDYSTVSTYPMIFLDYLDETHSSFRIDDVVWIQDGGSV